MGQATERPLSAVEQWVLATSTAACLNFAAVGRVEGPLDEARLRAAIGLVQARHPLLTVRVDDSGDTPWFRAAEGRPLPLRIESQPDWVAAAEEELATHLDWRTGPLVRVVWLRESADVHHLIVCFHHVIGDGRSGLLLLRDLVQAAGGVALAPSPRAATVPQPLETRLRAEHLGPGARAAGAWRLLRDMVADGFLGAPSRPRVDALAPPHAQRDRIRPRTLDPAETSALAAAARAHGTTVHGVLSAALLLEIVADLGSARRVRVGFGSAVDLREALSEPVGDDVGYFVSALLYRGRHRAEDDLWGLARAIRRGIVRDKARGVDQRLVPLVPAVARLLGMRRLAPEAFAARWDRLIPSTAGLTNLGVVRLAQRANDLFLESAHFVASTSMLAWFVSSVTTFGGRLFWNFTTPEPLFDDAHGEALADGAVARLRRAFAAPSKPD